MSINRTAVMAACLGLTMVAGTNVASAAHVEALNGEFSSNYLLPTPVVLTPNAQTFVSGSIAGAGANTHLDVDYFTVTVPAGQQLSAMFVRAGTTSGGNGSFLGLNSGAVGTNPASPSAANLLGYYLYGAGDIGTDILDNIATFNFMGSNPAQGFTPPLPAGNYTFWIQEGSLGTFSYNFDLQLTPVPEPTGLAALAGAGILALRRRRRA